MNNILFVTLDQLRYDALGHMGAFPIETPNFDMVAENGTRFDYAYCSNPICVPSRASITTGQYCYDHGVYYNSQGWHEEVPTLFSELRDNGYYTVAVGKMHFLPRRLNRGFVKRSGDYGYDYHEYLEREGIPDYYEGYPKGDGTPHYDKYIKHEYTKEAWDRPERGYPTVYTTNVALHELDLLEQRRECKPGQNEPFFMWLSYIKPHTACDAPEPYYSMYDPDSIKPPNRTEQELNNLPGQLKRYKRNWDVLTDEDVKQFRAKYLGNVTMVDAQFGRIIDKLKEMGIYENTLIVISSDHGDHAGDHWMHQKSFFFDCSARVPFIFAGPGIPKGKVVTDNVSQIDLKATLLEYCELALPPLWDKYGNQIQARSEWGDGYSLMPLINDTDAPYLDNRIIVSESGIHGQHIMLKRGTEKFNYYEDTGEIEYFDLAEDPDEQHNHLGKYTLETLPEDIRERLKDILERTRKYHTMYYRQKDTQWKMMV